MENNYFMGNRGYVSSYLASTNPNPNTNIIWTMGLESAKAYPVAPGRTVLLMDSESPTFFIKAVDNNGFAAMKSFSFVENQPSAVEEPSAAKFVTNDQLQEALSQLMAKIEALIPQTKNLI